MLLFGSPNLSLESRPGSLRPLVFALALAWLLMNSTAYGFEPLLTGKEGETVFGKGSITDCAFSPDGSLFATSSGIGLFLWDAETLKLQNFYYEPRGIELFKWFDDGSKILASIGYRDRLWTGQSSIILSAPALLLEDEIPIPIVWRGIADAQYVRGYLSHRTTSISPDGILIAFLLHEGGVRIYDVIRRTFVREIPIDSSAWLFAVQFIEDGSTLLVGDMERYLWRIDVQEGDVTDSREFEFGYPYKFTSDGRYAVGVHPDRGPSTTLGWSAFLIDLQDEILLKTIQYGGRALHIEISTDDRHVYVITDHLYVYDWENIDQVQIKAEMFTNSPLPQPLSPDGSEVVFLPENESLGALYFHDAETGNLNRILKDHQGARSFFFTGDSQNLIVAGELRPRNFEEGERPEGIQQIWTINFSRQTTDYREYPGQDVSVWGIPAVSPQNANEFVTQGGDLFDITTMQSRRVISDFINPLYSTFSFTNDGAYLLSAAGNIRVFDGLSYTLLRTLSVPSEELISADMNSTADKIVAGGNNGRVFLFDLATGEREEVQLHFIPFEVGDVPMEVVFVSFLEDEGITISAGRENKIILFDWRTRQIIDEYSDPDFSIREWHSLALSPDKRYLFVGGRLYDLQSRRLVRRLSDEYRGLGRIQFSPDGKWLALITKEGNIRYTATDGAIHLWRFEDLVQTSVDPWLLIGNECPADKNCATP